MISVITSGACGGGGSVTVSVAVPTTPFGAVAIMVASPTRLPVARPLFDTLATLAGVLVDDQVKVTPGITTLALVYAVALNWPVVFCAMVVSGRTVMWSTTAGGGVTPSSGQTEGRF